MAFIAVTAIVVLQVLTVLANYWYTFGLWPISWTSFVLCATAQLILSACMTKCMKEIKK